MQGFSEEVPTPKKASPVRTKQRILVVEDDPATRSGIQELLEEEGCDVDWAADGAQALDSLKRAPEARTKRAAKPALILLDLTMPGMNGWDFRREQLRDPVLAGIPVVVMTGYAEYGDAVADLRANGHLQKPVRPEELRGVLRRFR